MDEQTNVTAAIADWAHGLSFEDISSRVVEEAKNQVLSVIAGIHAGHFSDIGRMVSRTMKDWSPSKESTLIPSGERTSSHCAIFGNAALSMALLYDDSLLGAHPGATSVVVSLALAEQLGASGKDLVISQIIANETAARLGLAMLTDPLSDYRTPAAHRLAAALAAAKLRKLDAAQTYSALALAVQDPGIGVRAGFIGSDAKILGAAMAAPGGVQAAELAENGLTAHGDPIGGEHGLLDMVGRRGAAGAFRSLGEIWLTETLTYAPYPCSTHVAGAVDCVATLLRQHNVDGRKVDKVEVTVGPDARELDEEARRYFAANETNPSALAFSIRYCVAATLLDKEFSPRQLTRDRIRDDAVWDLANRVEVVVDPASESDLRERSLRRQVERAAQTGFDVGRIDLRGVRAALATKVRLQLKNDRVLEIQRDAPMGAGSGPFGDDRVKTVEDKFRRETRYTLRKERMEKAIDLVHHLERATPANVKEIVRNSCSER
jgi:2-methylcitrate dehydratase PrpD